jgi:hypothetical protein
MVATMATDAAGVGAADAGAAEPGAAEAACDAGAVVGAACDAGAVVGAACDAGAADAACDAGAAVDAAWVAGAAGVFVAAVEPHAAATTASSVSAVIPDNRFKTHSPHSQLANRFEPAPYNEAEYRVA